MDKLPTISPTSRTEIHTSAPDKKIFSSNTGLLISAFIVLVVIVGVLADIKLTDFNAMLNLGTSFFVLLFCNYAMYINQLDSGIKNGKLDETYKKVCKKYNELKQQIVNAGLDYRMNDFCLWFVAEELKSARTSVLAASGVSYKTYEPFIGMDEVEVLNVEGLSTNQKEAIIKANALKPIYLNADMIMQRESAKKRKTKPRLTPTNKRNIKSGFKLGKLFINSALVSAVAFDVILNLSLATIAATFFKVLFVLMNGFAGYRDGFESITVDTVDYLNFQIDLMNQFFTWEKKNPVTE